MHRGQPGGIGEIHLRHRKRERICVRQPDQTQAHKQLADDMCNPLERVAAADIERPFALDGAVRERFAVKRLGDGPVGRDQLLESGTVELAIGDRCQRADRVVHPRKQVDVGIAGVAGQDEIDDLPPAVFQHLVAARPTGQEHANQLAAIAFAGDILAGAGLENPLAHRGFDQAGRAVGQFAKGVEPPDERSHLIVVPRRGHHAPTAGV